MMMMEWVRDGYMLRELFQSFSHHFSGEKGGEAFYFAGCTSFFFQSLNSGTGLEARAGVKAVPPGPMVAQLPCH